MSLEMLFRPAYVDSVFSPYSASMGSDMFSEIDDLVNYSDLIIKDEPLFDPANLGYDIPNCFTEFDETTSDTVSHTPEDILHHDCMWSGQCLTPGNPCAQKVCPYSLVSPNDVLVTTPSQPQLSVLPQQSVLKSSVLKQTLTTISPTEITSLLNTESIEANLLTPPRTPPTILKDEQIADPPDADNTNFLEILNMAISEYDLNTVDKDLMEYLEKKEVKTEIEDDVFIESDGDLENEDESEDSEESQESDMNTSRSQYDSSTSTVDVTSEPQTYTRPCNPFENDHSYHKDAYAQDHMNYTLTETPSDSDDEEIDVVSIPTRTFPTRPTIHDKQQIQCRMVSAIDRRKINICNNITYPTRRAAFAPPRAPTPPPPIRRKAATGKGNKRKVGRPAQQNKRRRARQDSEDEMEPAEKRNLHNNMERKRRIDLSISFNTLRCMVPKICDNEKASKVMILRESASYCDELTSRDINFEKRIFNLRHQQALLKERLRKLRISAKREIFDKIDNESRLRY